MVIQLHTGADDIVRLWRVKEKTTEEVGLDDLQLQRMPSPARDYFLDEDFPVDDLTPEKHRLQFRKALLSCDVTVLCRRPLPP